MSEQNYYSNVGFIISVFFLSVGFAAPAFAVVEADEFGSASSVITSKNVSRNYLGGKEEDELRVQSILPQPSRYIEARSEDEGEPTRQSD
jgi:hypothetical protein